MRSISLFLRSVTKSLILFTTLSFIGVYTSHAQTAAEGATLFKQKCTSCHALDKKVVGPALKGVSERHKEAWLLKWINNAPSMIASGDKEATALASEYKPMVMTAFPELTPDNVKGILAYIKAEETKPATTVGDPVSNAETGDASKSNDGVSNWEIGGVIAIAIIALLVIFVLNRVIKSLERVALQKQGVVVEEAVASGPVYKKLLKNKKFIFFMVLILIIFLGSAGWKGMWETGVHQGYQPVQPIKFSHQLHAGINKIDCQYCHTGAYKSKNASIPSLNVCMNCHNYVQATEKYNGEISPEIQKIYKALDYNPDTKVYGPNKKPVEWIRIHNLQDFAYFNHSQHVKVAGIQCQKCHGPIQTMSEVYQYSPLTMKWCINCHKETEVNHKGNAYYDRLISVHEKYKKGEKMTAAVMGGLECGKCHY